jgi:hypothetical protein
MSSNDDHLAKIREEKGGVRKIGNLYIIMMQGDLVD